MGSLIKLPAKVYFCLIQKLKKKKQIWDYHQKKFIKGTVSVN